MRNAGLEEAQTGIKIAGRNINNLRHADDTTLMAENEELKSLLMKVKGVGEDSEVPWTARRSKQSILKEISPECSLEGLMLRLQLQYFGYLMRIADSFEKTLMLGKTEGRRRK